MDCREAKTLMLDARRGTLPPDARAAFRAHLAGCEECRADDAADRELSRVLDRLPKRSAPAALRASIARRAPKLRASRVAAIVLFAAVAVALFFWIRGRAPDAIVNEAVNDHLRVLYAERQVEVESGGIHQVKPWFAGRLDFAPALAFAGDDDFPLQGGSVAYFVDRKAAAFVFKRRLHVITLLVFRADGLPWQAGGERMGRATARTSASRGFNVVTWRDGDLGYALVSDVDAKELFALGARIAGG